MDLKMHREGLTRDSLRTPLPVSNENDKIVPWNTQKRNTHFTYLKCLSSEFYLELELLLV